MKEALSEPGRGIFRQFTSKPCEKVRDIRPTVTLPREFRMTHCVLLNADYTFLNVVHWKRAVCLLAKGKVEVVKASAKTIRSSGGAVLRIPAVLRLIKLIRTIYRTGVAFCKKNVFIRDGFKCAYCGTQKLRLTIDHIIPRSRGGRSNFDNCVAACKPCNIRKGDRTPSEAGMFLKIKPVQPTVSEFLRLKLQKLGINDVLKDFGVY
jgi:5-methylcytosine-specific restriction endonuclease McrA